MPERIAVLASGSGSNLQALIDARLPIRMVLVNRPKAKALERAQNADIDAKLIDHKSFDSREAFEQALVDALVEAEVTWVVLAGFMRVLGSTFLSAFADHIVNIHPSLLPSFPGLHAQRQALEAGVRIAGCTVHLVNEGVDAGPILAQAAVPVLPDDDETSLSNRILRREHQLYPAVVKALVEGRLQLRGGRVQIEGGLGLGREPGWLAGPES